MTNKKIKEDLKTEGELVKALRSNAELKDCSALAGKKMRDGTWSYRDFEGYMNEGIFPGMPGETTFQSVWDWEHEVYAVTSECLMAWMHFYRPDDPRHKLAVDVFALRMKRAHWVGANAEGKTQKVEGKKVKA